MIDKSGTIVFLFLALFIVYLSNSGKLTRLKTLMVSGVPGGDSSSDEGVGPVVPVLPGTLPQVPGTPGVPTDGMYGPIGKIRITPR